MRRSRWRRWPFIRAIALACWRTEGNLNSRFPRGAAPCTSAHWLIVWLTDLAETPATPEVIESAMQMTSRHLVLFGVIKQPELAELAGRSPETAREMYHHVAAQEMLDRRELLLRRLQQQGAMAMEFDPARFTPMLVNRYLEIKERSLL